MSSFIGIWKWKNLNTAIKYELNLTTVIVDFFDFLNYLFRITVIWKLNFYQESIITIWLMLVMRIEMQAFMMNLI